MKSSDIRKTFLKYFQSKGHAILPSSSLIPNDPSILLTVAGMVQFKPVFLGLENPAYKRVATVQRCIRTNDLDNVGRTARHHTFFEMLGNFSFGDYFKEDAIAFAWELLTRIFSLPKEKLWIAVYEEDDQSFDIWAKKINIPSNKIVRLGEDNNFWAAGPTGPCGPCSEIYFDLGEKFGCGLSACGPGCDCDRFLEIWNLVFMEFNRDENGKLFPLPRKNIDTGMGLERISSVLQGVATNFDTDLFVPIIEKIKDMSNMSEEKIFSLSSRIIADHVRASSFLIMDGLTPSNEGRNYVLRRLIRRAAMHGKKLNIKGPFISKLTPVIAKIMGEDYPEYISSLDKINNVLNSEEEVFDKTLDNGMEMLKSIIAKSKSGVISGEDAFKLYDTYGFPVEMTTEIASERGLSVDIEGFKDSMAHQQEKSKRYSKKFFLSTLPQISGYPQTQFVGYETLETEAIVIGVVDNFIILDKSPFYTESGGQDSDRGWLIIQKNKFEVEQIGKTAENVILHKISSDLKPKIGEKVRAIVDEKIRKMIAAHHTSTHLLHAALHKIIGKEALQKGSFVGSDKFRLDFSCPRALTDEEIKLIEEFVNDVINKSIEVETIITTFEEAKKLGAVALFGEKYGEKVRMVVIDDISKELCGGTHVKNTKDIGLFKIIKESAISQGIRRIEAVSGENAREYIKQVEEEQAKKREIEEKRRIEKEEEKKQEMAIKNVPLKEFEINGLKIIFFNNDNFSPKIIGPFLRNLVSGFSDVVAFAMSENSILISVKCSSNKKIDASHILREIFTRFPGKGGGRADFAQGSFSALSKEQKEKVFEFAKILIAQKK